MADTTPTLGLTVLTEGQDAAEVSVNSSFNIIDALFAGAEDFTATPPGSPTNGQVYLVATGATGAWAGQDGKVAAYYTGWIFLTPKEGWRIFVKDEDAEYLYDGTAWTALAQRLSLATGITAFAGGGQGSATQLTKEVNRVTTVATAGDSVKLPTAVAGMQVTVINDGASSMDVFPASGAAIDSEPTNSADAVAVGKVVTYYAISATLWRSQIGA